MGDAVLNTGIIYTNDRCIGCSKCISGCIAMGANVVVHDSETGKYTVGVDAEKCVLCGSCISTCVHKARTYSDDTDAFFDALTAGEKISLLVSPTLLTDYHKQYNNILGYLKHLGVQHMYSTGFGGDLMVWVYVNFIESFGLTGAISQCCPVITNYLEKYKPELLSHLLPVQSPAMCTAIYVSDYLQNTDKLAYISPCIASKYEAEDVNTYGKVTYTVTFERLLEKLEGIDISQYYEQDELTYGLGGLIPMSGGLSDNIERFIGFDEVLIQTEGPTHIFPYFDHYYKEVNEGGQLPFLVDALCCTNGCNFGTGAKCGAELRNEMTFSAHKVKENAYRSGVVAGGSSHHERLELLNKRFDEFELSSFVRQYDLTRKVSRIELAPECIDGIFASMHKNTPEQRHTDCGSCGYLSCYDMAYAIGVGVNCPDNCINYSRECVRRETEKITTLLSAISAMNEELKQATQLKSNFLANMSHEIRTPMNAIIGMAEMALRGSLGVEEREYLRQIQTSGRSLLAIINDILDFSKIESGRMELNETEYKVMSIINDTVNIVMTRIGEKDISLFVDVDPNIPAVLYGDDIRIKQVLVNLANNAVKFTERGSVTLLLGHHKLEDGNICLSVSVKDTGIGIKPEDVKKLFSSFQQVDSKRNRNVEGTGLGLAISKQLVELMNGEVRLDSVYGEGSTFGFDVPQRVVSKQPGIKITTKGRRKVRTASYVEVPERHQKLLATFATLSKVANTDCQDLQELEKAMKAGATVVFVDFANWNEQMRDFADIYDDIQFVVIVDPRKEIVSESYVRKLHLPVYSYNVANAINNHDEDIDNSHNSTEELVQFVAPDAKILIVDDNAINLTVAKGLLAPFKMNLTGVMSAREAIALLEQEEYDIVFMDHMMPDIDGVEATRIIRAKQGDYFSKLPIIALTANAINNAREMFLSEGMNDFVAKPIEMADITAKLHKWLPDNKVQAASGSESSSGEENSELIIKGINTRMGIALTGSPELYRAVLADYHKVIESKAAVIEQAVEENDLARYTIEVHALKSASKLIGAEKLGELAANLEAAGHSGDWESIRSKTPQMLVRYRSLITRLAPYAAVKVQVEQSSVSTDELTDRLTTLVACLDDFDLDGAGAVMGEVQGYQLDEQGNDYRTRLQQQVDSMEYDVAAELAREWCGKLAAEVS